MMIAKYLNITLLWIVFGAVAIDIELYKTDNRCEGDDFDFCINVAAGSCCGSLDRLYQSCQALGASIEAYSSRPATGDICYYRLGGSFECWGISNDINAISGCKSTPGSLQSIKRTKRTKNQEHDVVSNSAEECTEPSYHGRRIGGKRYGIATSRPEFEEYKNISGVEEKNEFFIKNADIVQNE